MNQMTVRQVPRAVHERLRELARQRNTSLNKTVIALLSQAVGLEPGATRKRDMSDLAGTWDSASAKEFQENTKAFEVIDEEMWGPTR